MQTTANTNLVLNGYSSSKPLAKFLNQNRQTGLYQQSAVLWLIQRGYKQAEFRRLGQRLIALAEHAYALRRMDMVAQASLLIGSLPLAREYGKVAEHYQ